VQLGSPREIVLGFVILAPRPTTPSSTSLIPPRWDAASFDRLLEPMSELGQKRKWRRFQVMSALPHKADIDARDVRFVPENEPARAGGRWPGGRAHYVYRSNHLNERR
jgi:hypothetical protein